MFVEHHEHSFDVGVVFPHLQSKNNQFVNDKFTIHHLVFKSHIVQFLIGFADISAFGI